MCFSFTVSSQISNKDCDCPQPTAEQFSNLCVAIYQKNEASKYPNASFQYQEVLWEMACVDPLNDSKEERTKKIQCVWNKYRTLFRCYGYPTSIASDANVTKFSMDTGFTPFLTDCIRYNNLDMNFIDPADGKTLLDWMKERINYFRHLPPVDLPKVEEYERYYKLLRDNGAKHKIELE